MRTETITKAEVIDALTHEPLAGGRWVEDPFLDRVGDCQVCAVGAVLRRRFKFTNAEIIDHAATMTQNAHYRSGPVWALELMRKNYLGALSIFFELRALMMPEDALRQAAIKFVAQNFPDSFAAVMPEPPTLEVPG